MRKFLILFFLSAVSLSAQQKLSYVYDNAGNRKSRTIIIDPQQAARPLKNDSIYYQEVLANKEIKIYPNPVKTNLTVNISGYDQDLKGEYFLFDAQGKMILHDKLNTESFQINMSSYAVGNYIMRIVINEESTTWEILKK